jgi:hypothetical protein
VCLGQRIVTWWQASRACARAVGKKHACTDYRGRQRGILRRTPVAGRDAGGSAAL